VLHTTMLMLFAEVMCFWEYHWFNGEV